ncbi:hypothetical protein [Sanguibacter sp. HDW7]|uniref:hypothetical protein n=1 Tax=Sanguibacter sp. HDW7 TaxID=2714931 RepID=UPI00140C3A9C|nr:hypothetical protein [Sanguibacter sp. HDW7]QIK82980.1 hypothetical protein G7063_04575 [Sanguibacter sp. HDW7]
MTEAVWVQIVVALGLVAVAVINKRDSRATRREVRAVRADTAAVREQTENSHASAEFPIMRDQQDEQLAVSRATHDQVLALAEVQRGMDRRLGRLERQASDLRAADVATDDTLDRHEVDHARALARAIADRDRALIDLAAHFEQRVPELIAAALDGHVAACPLRTPRP